MLRRAVQKCVRLEQVYELAVFHATLLRKYTKIDNGHFQK